MKYYGFRVGVFYNNLAWMIQWFEEFIDKYKPYIQEARMRHGNPFIIRLYDGTTITSVKPDDTSRGHKFDRVFVDPSIDMYSPGVYSRITGSCVSQKVIVEE